MAARNRTAVMLAAVVQTCVDDFERVIDLRPASSPGGRVQVASPPILMAINWIHVWRQGPCATIPTPTKASTAED